MDEDVWDLFVVQQFFGEEYVKRLGAQRAKHIDILPQYIYSDVRAHSASYFTKGGGFLSLDVGLKIKAHRLPAAQIIGLIPDALGITFLISTSSVTDVHVKLDVETDRFLPSGRREVSATRLSSGIYGARLEVGEVGEAGEVEATVAVSVKNDAGDARVTLADGLAVPGAGDPALLSVTPSHEGRFVAKRAASDRVEPGIFGKLRRKRSRLG